MISPPVIHTAGGLVSQQLVAHVKWAEGYRAKPYYCPTGHLSIGYGRNLEAHPVEDQVLDKWRAEGISEPEAASWLQSHVTAVASTVLEKWPWLQRIDPARRDVFIDMAYNMGVTGLSLWPKTLAAAKAGQWVNVAKYLASSRYAKQTGRRARVLIEQIRTGEYPPLDARWDSALAFRAYREHNTIMVRRLSDGGRFSTTKTTRADAQAFCDAEYAREGIGAPAKDIDWSDV